MDGLRECLQLFAKHKIAIAKWVINDIINSFEQIPFNQSIDSSPLFQLIFIELMMIIIDNWIDCFCVREMCKECCACLCLDIGEIRMAQTHDVALSTDHHIKKGIFSPHPSLDRDRPIRTNEQTYLERAHARAHNRSSDSIQVHLQLHVCRCDFVVNSDCTVFFIFPHWSLRFVYA